MKTQVKFIYSEKATKFCEISTLLLSVCTVDKSKVEISQNFVAFSEYTNFKAGKSNIDILGVPALQTRSLYRLQGSPCVVILPCKDPVKITGYHSNPSSSVVGT